MLLRVESLCKRYAHADGPVDALKDVSLDVEEGAFVTVTGASGSGKTTLLLALGGLPSPRCMPQPWLPLSTSPLRRGSPAMCR